MKNFRRILCLCLLSVIAVGISSCSKDNTTTTGPAGPAGPSLKGDLKGHIFCYDQYGVPILGNLSLIGIKDSMNGTTNVVHPDSTGAYTFSSLSTGNYSFTITASGYGTNMVQNIQFVGGGNLNHDVKISQIPSYYVGNLYDSIAPAADTLVFIKGALATSDVQVRTVVVFVSNNINCSYQPQYYLDYFSANTTATGSNFSIKIPKTTFNNMGIASGSTAYVAAYGVAVNFASSSEYEDLSTGRTVFNALNTTPYTMNFIVP
ncbi:MAG: carboxypeptidase-like regulatory domain-containing protein [Bacteroidales bacterium]